MSTYLTPPNRTLVHLSRPHDYLYDPNYSMPNREDFLRNAEFGIKAGARVTLRPIFQNFFSALDNARRIRPCLTIPEPSNIENFLPQYDMCGVPVMPMDTGPLCLPRLIDDVTGADRAKYAIRYGSTSYQMHTEPFDFNKLSPDEKKKILQTEKTQKSGFVNRGIQTDMRESETQTDPYSPPYKLINPASYPKVLALAKLTWGKGLPFTLDDIVVIERALSKRILDRTDRITEDKAAFDARVKLMEELETQQWSDRERELERIMQTKLEITNRLLSDYASKVAADHTMRLERLQGVLAARNAERLKLIKHQYFRHLRQLEKKYLEDKPTMKRNVIKDYLEFDSSIYASLVRNGPHMDLLNPVPDFQFDLHRDLETFQQLTESKGFIKGEIEFDVEAFKERIKACGPSSAEQRLDRKLEKIYLAFKDWNIPKKLDINKYVPPDGSHRGSLQIITLDSENEEGRRRPHCITLQKIARGRTIQKMIRKEIYDNMNELLGMKQMFDMDPNCLRVEESQFQKLLNLKKQAEAEAAKDPEVKEVIGNLEGETLNKMLEFLDKEMIRLIDERKIHALILMAERERRRKEAKEAGRRFVEEENRRTNDEIFRQVVGIHQATVDLYLEDIYIEAADRTADETSRNYVRQLAATLNEAAYSASLGDYEQEELAAEIVSGYMVPELSRLTHQEKLDAARSRYKKAAAQVVRSMFGAQQLLKQIEDGPLPTLIEAKELIGFAAIDGSLNAVDDFIKQAVDGVIKAEDEAAVAATALREVEAEAARILAEQTASEQEEEQEERQIERPSLKPESSMMEMLMAQDELEIKKLEMEEEEKEEAEERVFEDPTIVVTDCFKGKFAAKALQIDLEMEPTPHVETLYRELTCAVDDIIIEARRQVVPDPPKERERRLDDEDTDDD